MVTIIGYTQAKNEKGEDFNLLDLQGEVEMVKSEESGKFYATARETSIPSTFDQEKCKKLIGTTMPGKIQRESCDPYEYELENGEKIILEHTYEYNPAPVSTEDHVFESRENGVALNV